jgi:hypothetical protein
LNENVSKANSEIQRAVIDAQIRNPARSDNVPLHISADFHQRDVSAGLLPEKPSVPPVLPSIIMRRQQEFIVEHPVFYQPEQQASTELNVVMYSGHKRKANQLTIAQEGEEEVQRKRAPKKCWKCEKTGCAGATGKQKCISVCKSCGTHKCPGKNSRYPTMPCPTLLKK